MADKKQEVLVIEDDPEINELIGAYVQLAGFEYRGVVNGQSALEAVDKFHPDVIVLDLMLPDLDGIEVCRRLKLMNGVSNIPVIILTALDTVSSREKGKNCGASEYMVKPFDPDTLMRAIGRHAGAGRQAVLASWSVVESPEKL